jgi:uncharacterized membrane protein
MGRGDSTMIKNVTLVISMWAICFVILYANTHSVWKAAISGLICGAIKAVWARTHESLWNRWEARRAS